MDFSHFNAITLVTGALGNIDPIEFYDEIYHELRRIAKYAMRKERRDHTLQPTALVHEACLKLADHKRDFAGDRTQLLATASRIMRCILIDYARSRNADKRGGELLRVSLGQANFEFCGNPEIEALEEQLVLLEKIAPRQAQILELKYFGGLTIDEIAGYFNLATRTIQKDLKLAKGWLFTRLGNGQ